jgi:hypothetical protein
MLYTIVPPEIIFGESEETAEGGSDNSLQEIEIKEGGASLLVQRLPNGQSRLSRVISTDPQDYLKPEWQPGSLM